MGGVLCVGIATVDIINRVARYPDEDSEVRALSQVCRMGGNAANTAIVLAQLGVSAAWTGNLPGSAQIIEREFARFDVDIARAVRIDEGVAPTSYITLSDVNGSRSIVHYRDLPEYPAAAFLNLELNGLDWVHFEGRAVDELGPMIGHARSFPGLRLSLEVEKARPGIERLFDQADLLMFSPDYAHAQGFNDAISLLETVAPGREASCTWGAEGAWATDASGRILHAPAPTLDAVVDTVGAGDVFNAGLIHALRRGQPLQRALQHAVELASAQCARDGLVLPAG